MVNVLSFYEQTPKQCGVPFVNKAVDRFIASYTEVGFRAWEEFLTVPQLCQNRLVLLLFLRK
jgi:hypothetical protein